MERIILCSGSYDGTIAIWDLPTERVIKTPAVPPNQIPIRLSVSLQKSQLAAALTSCVKLYDLNQGRIPVKASFQGFNGNVMGVGFQKDCKWLFCCSEDGSVRVLDPRKPGVAKLFRVACPVNAVVLSNSQSQLYSGDQSGMLRCFNLQADKERQSVQLKKAISSLSIASDDQFLVAAEAEGDFTILRPKDSAFVPGKALKAHGDYLVGGTLSPDNRLYATCSADKSARVFSIGEEGKLRKTLIGHSKWVWDAYFNSDSDYLITASSDSSIKIWSIAEGEALKTLKGHHKLAVNCIAFNDRT